MNAPTVAQYLDTLDEPKRATLQALRETLLKLLPQAEECFAYGAPAYKVGGKAVAGFAAYKDHLSYFPHSGSVLDVLGAKLSGYRTTKGALWFAVDAPLPKGIVEELVAARLRELAMTQRSR